MSSPNLKILKIHISIILFFSFLVVNGVWATERSADKTVEISVDHSLSTDEIIRQALNDSLYYRFDSWFDLFKQKIAELERLPDTVTNRLAKIRYHFYYAGLLGELCHTLAFTSKYKIPAIEKLPER